MTLTQILIIAAIYSLIYCLPGWMILNQFLGLPFAIGPVVGLVMGDVVTGTILGAAVQTLNMAITQVGGTMSTDVYTAEFVAVPIAMSAGIDLETTIAIAAPFVVLGTFFTPLTRILNGAIFVPLAEKHMEQADIKKLNFDLYILPILYLFPLRFIPMAVVLAAGETAITAIIAALPDWALHSLNVMGGILPGIGFAMFINFIGDKKLLPFFFLGFYIVYVLGCSTIIMTIFAVIAGILHVSYVNKEEPEGNL